MGRTGWSGVLLGRDPERSRQFLLFAVGVFAVGLGLWGVLWVVNALDVVFGFSIDVVLWALVVLAVGPAVVHAYLNDGLLVCWALGVALPLALYLVPTASPSMPPDETVWWGIGAALQLGVPAGTVGYAVGWLARLVAVRFGVTDVGSGS